MPCVVVQIGRDGSSLGEHTGIRDDLKTTTTRGFPVAAKLKWAELQQKNVI